MYLHPDAGVLILGHHFGSELELRSPGLGTIRMNNGFEWDLAHCQVVLVGGLV